MSAIPLSALATSRRWQSNFLAVLPAVQTHASIQFRRLKPEARAEATAETVAAACVSYATLARQKKLDRVYVTNIATFAVQRVRGHRQVGGHQNSTDVLNPKAQKEHGLAVTSITPWDGEHQTWKDVAVESRKIGPADMACFRLDFQTWLRRWSPRHRQIINALASGMGTGEVAVKFSVSEPRISQFRRRYEQSWELFQSGNTTREAA